MSHHGFQHTSPKIMWRMLRPATMHVACKASPIGASFAPTSQMNRLVVGVGFSRAKQREDLQYLTGRLAGGAAARVGAFPIRDPRRRRGQSQTPEPGPEAKVKEERFERSWLLSARIRRQTAAKVGKNWEVLTKFGRKENRLSLHCQIKGRRAEILTAKKTPPRTPNGMKTG